MKRPKKIHLAILSCFFFVIPVLSSPAPGQGGASVDATQAAQMTQSLKCLFDALRTGDVDTLKRLFQGELYEKRKALLESNADYPQFLRDYYQDAVFQIKDIYSFEDGFAADVVIFFSEDKMDNIRLKMVNSTNYGEISSLKLSNTELNRCQEWIFINQIHN